MVVVGNGDVLTHYEAAARRAAAPSVRGLMVGRGALVKPWIFAEISSGRTWCPSAAERVAVYFRLSQLMKVRLDACELRWTLNPKPSRHVSLVCSTLSSPGLACALACRATEHRWARQY